MLIVSINPRINVLSRVLIFGRSRIAVENKLSIRSRDNFVSDADFHLFNLIEELIKNVLNSNVFRFHIRSARMTSLLLNRRVYFKVLKYIPWHKSWAAVENSQEENS